MKTMLLDILTWDIVLDVSGNLALASDPYSQAQDAASQIRLFAGELYYDIDQGIPYYEQILGRIPPIQLMKAKFEQAALLVPGVAQADVFIQSFTNRQVVGQVQITNLTGLTATAPFAF